MLDDLVSLAADRELAEDREGVVNSHADGVFRLRDLARLRDRRDRAHHVAPDYLLRESPTRCCSPRRVRLGVGWVRLKDSDHVDRFWWSRYACHGHHGRTCASRSWRHQKRSRSSCSKAIPWFTSPSHPKAFVVDPITRLRSQVPDAASPAIARRLPGQRCSPVSKGRYPSALRFESGTPSGRRA